MTELRYFFTLRLEKSLHKLCNFRPAKKISIMALVTQNLKLTILERNLIQLEKNSIPLRCKNFLTL